MAKVGFSAEKDLRIFQFSRRRLYSIGLHHENDSREQLYLVAARTSRLSRNIPSVSLLHCSRRGTHTRAIVDFASPSALLVYLEITLLGRTWAFLLATARCVGGGSEEKRRRARMTVTWHRRGLLFCPDLSVFREVLCRDCVRPSFLRNPTQHRF